MALLSNDAYADWSNSTTSGDYYKNYYAPIRLMANYMPTEPEKKRDPPKVLKFDTKNLWSEANV